MPTDSPSPRQAATANHTPTPTVEPRSRVEVWIDCKQDENAEEFLVDVDAGTKLLELAADPALADCYGESINERALNVKAALKDQGWYQGRDFANSYRLFLKSEALGQAPPPESALRPVTPTPAAAFTLSGVVFFDHNGNGAKDVGEPPIEGASISAGDKVTLSGPDGTYTLERVPAGEQRMQVDGPSDQLEARFRYITRLRRWVDIPAHERNGVTVPEQDLTDSAIQPVSSPLNVRVGGDVSLDVGLTHGFLTLPFHESTDYLLWSYVDLDHRLGHIRNYANESVWPVNPFADINSPTAHAGTHDNHQGIDYNMANGNYLLAMAGGVVLQAENQYHYVRLRHELGPEVYVTGYGHNQTNLVRAGEHVLRGQIIALSGDWAGGLACQPHVHVSHWIIPDDWRDDPIYYIFEDELRDRVPFSDRDKVPTVDDPYRDVLDPEAVSYWTVDNDPKFPGMIAGR
jgi:murein DD-endopeptidase MepM/ murein hydrolase activator NlpD